MSYNDEEYGRVVESTGEYARPEALNGHLVIVFPVGYHEHLQTRFSMPGKKSDALCCDIVDLDDKDADGLPGKVYRSSNLMQSQLIVGLRPFIGRKVLGRIGKGVSKTGMNAPWIITDMSTDPVAMERAKAWKVANPDFVTSPFMARDPLAVPMTTAPVYQDTITQPALVPAAPVDVVPVPAAPVVAAPVPGSSQLTVEELNLLQKLRMDKARREAENPFEDKPPF